MAIHDSCADCKGHGYFLCGACTCKSCEASGKVKCAQCKSGRVSCKSCGATGVIDKSGWILTRSETCPDCKGGKTVACRVCKGSSTATCPSCKGSGRDAQCSSCGGTKKITCHACSGSGKVVSQWVKSLNDFPVDRLRFEYEKRERELSRLQHGISDLKREEEQINNDWNEASSNLSSGADYRNFDAGGYQGGLAHVSNQISEVNGRMNELIAEMGAIEQALNAKWK